MAVGAPVASGPTAADLYAPSAAVGSESFLRHTIDSRVESTLSVARLCVAASSTPGLPASQVAGAALLRCVWPRVHHLLRTHFSVTLLSVVSAFDTSFRCVCSELWGVSTSAWPPASVCQYSLPLRLGGMGFRCLAAVAPAAFLGSWARVLPWVETALGFSVLDSTPTSFVISF